MKGVWIFIAGMVTGLVAAILLAVANYKSWSEEKVAFGRGQGYVDGAFAVIEFVDKAADDSSKKTAYFEIKDASFGVTRTEGFRTLRIESYRE